MPKRRLRAESPWFVVRRRWQADRRSAIRAT
jgi:hypothetical protein